jgi:hypothetical protein
MPGWQSMFTEIVDIGEEWQTTSDSRFAIACRNSGRFAHTVASHATRTVIPSFFCDEGEQFGHARCPRPAARGRNAEWRQGPWTVWAMNSMSAMRRDIRPVPRRYQPSHRAASIDPTVSATVMRHLAGRHDVVVMEASLSRRGQAPKVLPVLQPMRRKRFTETADPVTNQWS